MTDDQAPPPDDPDDIHPKVIAYRLKAMEARANEGAKTFAQVRNTLDAISRQTDERMDKAVERLAAENKADNAELRREVMEQVTGLKGEAAAIKDELRPKLIKILGMIGALAAVIIPVVYFFGKQPDRGEFEATKQRTLDNAQAIHDAQIQIQGLTKAIDRIEASERDVGGKIDQLLLRGNPKP